MKQKRGVILIVDDTPLNLNVLMNFLEAAGYKVLIATDGESAVEQAEYARPDIILLDVMMPGIDGFETCRRLKANQITQKIPVIFMTALTDTSDKVRGFEAGAVDYITKPLQQEEAIARVNTHLELARKQQRIEQLMEQDRVQFENLSYMKDQLLSTASHELKNPLASIMLSIEILKRSLNHDAGLILERLNVIQHSALYMRDLIANLLDIARLETQVELRKVEISINQLIRDSLSRQMSFSSEQGVALITSLSEKDITVYCEPFQIDQVVQNLLSNAIKYSPPGGKVEISTSSDGSNAYVEISDEGLGIPQQAIPYIFEKFYRVETAEHRAISGTGLGLSIVREIIRQHQGEIEVHSHEGKGTTFRLSLPIRSDPISYSVISY